MVQIQYVKPVMNNHTSHINKTEYNKDLFTNDIILKTKEYTKTIENIRYKRYSMC